MRREPALTLRMLVALALSVALLAAFAAGLVWLAIFVPSGWFVGVFALAFVAEGVRLSRMRARPPGAREPTAGDRQRVEAAIERLALVAGVRRPKAVVEADPAPLSWTTALTPGSAGIHVTTGMLDRLEDRELQAVLAHELTHLLHRDAILMTVLAGPPAHLLAGLREAAREGGLRSLPGMLIHGIAFGIPSALVLGASRVVSRHRELVADRTAALLTGSPASVAAALVAVSDGLDHIPEHDLRAAAPRDSLHFAPAHAPRRLLRAWATHPSLETRLERLDALEAG